MKGKRRHKNQRKKLQLRHWKIWSFQTFLADCCSASAMILLYNIFLSLYSRELFVQRVLTAVQLLCNHTAPYWSQKKTTAAPRLALHSLLPKYDHDLDYSRAKLLSITLYLIKFPLFIIIPPDKKKYDTFLNSRWALVTGNKSEGWKYIPKVTHRAHTTCY